MSDRLLVRVKGRDGLKKVEMGHIYKWRCFLPEVISTINSIIPYKLSKPVKAYTSKKIKGILKEYEEDDYFVEDFLDDVQENMDVTVSIDTIRNTIDISDVFFSKKTACKWNFDKKFPEKYNVIIRGINPEKIPFNKWTEISRELLKACEDENIDYFEMEYKGNYFLYETKWF